MTVCDTRCAGSDHLTFIVLVFRPLRATDPGYLSAFWIVNFIAHFVIHITDKGIWEREMATKTGHTFNGIAGDTGWSTQGGLAAARAGQC